MLNKRILTQVIVPFLTALSIFIAGMQSSLAADLSTTVLLAQADTEEQSQADTATEEVYVVGIRKSLLDAKEAKRDANRIMDTIQSEDIGKLPDFNVSEAMQRITGVQIDRDLIGDGSTFQVRGLSQNRVEINGRTLTSAGTDNVESRANFLNTTSSALFKAIEVIKSPTADMIEGSLGATVNLKTFKPLEFKSDNTLNVSGEISDAELADDTGYRMKALYSKKFETGLGEMGFMVNLDFSNKVTVVNQFNPNYQPVANNQSGGVASNLKGISSFRPHRGGASRRDIDSDNQGIDLSWQWAVSDNLDVYAQVTHTNNERTRDQSAINIFPQRGSLRFTEEPTVEFFRWTSSKDRADPNFLYRNTGSSNNPVWEPAPGTLVERGLISAGSLANNNFAGSQKITEAVGGREFLDEEQTAISFGAEWQLNDTLYVEANYARSDAFFSRDNLFTTFQPRAFLNNGATAPTISSNTELVPAVVWDFSAPTDLPTYFVDFSGVNQRLATEGSGGFNTGPIDLTEADFYSFNQLGGRFDEKNTVEDALRLDFDWDINMGGFTTLEFGLRVSRQERDRARDRYGAYTPYPNQVTLRDGSTATVTETAVDATGSVDWQTLSIFSQEWLSSDGDADVEPRDRTFLPELIAAGALPENFFFEPASDFVFEDFSGNITRRWPRTAVFDIDFFLNLAQTYFPGRAADPGPDGIFCNAKNNNKNTAAAVGNAADYTEYYNNPTNADPDAQACADDVRGINAFGVGTFTGFAFDLEEVVTAAYIKANFEAELNNGIPYFGNIGVRVVNTDFEGSAFDESLGVGNGLANDGQFVTNKQDYNSVLPSFNITFALSDNLYLRGALSRNLSRPDPVDLVPSRDIDNDNEGARIGNPNLQPLEADQADLSLEWYYDDDSLFSAAYFEKRLTNTIVNNIVLEPLGDTDGDGEEDFFETRSKINEPGGTIQGFELAYQTVFATLPSPLDGFGLSANYTHTDSESIGGLNQINGENPPIQDQSANSYNFILFWEKWGWSARIAYNFRQWSYNGVTQNRANVEGVGVVDQLATAAAKAVDPGAADVIGVLNAELPQFKDDNDQIDLEVSYKWNNWTFFANARDFDAGPRTSSVVLPNSNYLRSFDYNGTTYRYGVRYKLTF